jgi:radical SAM superfamily enzyme YgiQ (UPF0313 family)
MDYSQLPLHYHEYLDSFRDSSHPVWKEVRQVLASEKPDVVGISIWTTYAAAAFFTANICKEVIPNAVVVMGGPHAIAKADEILKICPNVDYVVRGDGEITMSELVRQISSGLDSTLSIPELSFRDKNIIVHNPSRQITNELELFPFPDRSLLMNENRYTSEDMGLIMSSKGCPFDCSYCATHTRRVRCRSIENVLDEIRLVKARYGTIEFCFKDDSFTVNKARVEEFCDKLIAENMRINWECNTRVDLVDESLLVKMKKAGCNSIKVGIESGSERILKKMNKGITLDQIRNAAKLLKRVGIFWTGYFMIGVPGETVDEIYQTLDIMYEIKPDFASISVYEPFPGTAMFDEGIEKGLVKPEMTLEDFYTTLPNDYYKLGPHKQVDTIGADDFIALAENMKKKFHIYNKNFERLWHRVKSRVSLYVDQPQMLWSDFNKYLTWR